MRGSNVGYASCCSPFERSAAILPYLGGHHSQAAEESKSKTAVRIPHFD